MSGALAAVCGANLLASLLLVAVLWLAWGLGRLVAGALHLTIEGTLDETVLSTGLGLGALSAATFLLGVAGLYRPAAFAVFFAALVTVALATSIPRFGRVRSSLRAWRAPWRDPATWVIAAAAAAAWLFALSPTVFYDTLVYHFAIPNLYLLRGGVEHLPNLVYSNFPLHAEMLYLLGLKIGGPRLAGVMNFGFAALTAAALASLVRRVANPSAGRTAAALFLLAPPVLLAARFGTVEIPLALSFTLEVWCLNLWREGEGRGWAAAAGLFAGWCFSTKYAGGLFALLPPLVFFTVAAVQDATARRRLGRDVLVLFGCSAAAALPWLVKNAVFTGNPVFPALYTIFGGRGWSAARGMALLADANAWWSVASSAGDFLRLPVDLVFNPARFGAAAASAWFWPVTLAAVVVALTAPRDRFIVRLCAILAGYLLLWVGSFWLARLLIPAMALGAALVALSLHRLWPERPAWRGALLAALAVWTAAALALDAPTRRSLAPTLGLQATDDYLTRMISSHPAVRFINERLSPEARVLVIGESRVAYLRRDHVHASALDPAPLAALVGETRDISGIEAGLARARITHLLVNNSELARIEREYPLAAMDPALKSALARFINERCRPLLRGGDIFLFALPGH
jgi:hypothetical protein